MEMHKCKIILVILCLNFMCTSYMECSEYLIKNIYKKPITHGMHFMSDRWFVSAHDALIHALAAVDDDGFAGEVGTEF